MTRLDDPALVAEEYADETRLRRRASVYTGETTSVDVRVAAVAAVVEAAPRRVLEVGCGVEEYIRASISTSPFVTTLPATIDEQFVARRASFVFVAERSG